MRICLLATLVFMVASAQDAPTKAEQSVIIEKTSELALQYTAKLPNFICTETINRFERRKVKDSWTDHDKLVLSVAYSEKGEQYKLQTINGKPTTKGFQNVSGFRSKGEFGSLLKRIFEKDSAALFQWEYWAKLKGLSLQVYSYKIDKSHSKYTFGFSSLLKHYSDTFAMKGLVFIDPTSNQVIRLTAEPEGIPTGWPIVASSSVVEYAIADVGGQQYLMPLIVEGIITLKDRQKRNVIQFSDYRKFSSEATINFEDSTPD